MGRRVTPIEWAFAFCVLLGCCSCQSIVKGSAAALGGAGGAIVSPAVAAAGAAGGYGLAEMYFQDEEIADLEAREEERQAQFLKLVEEVAAKASPQVRDEIAGTLADAAKGHAEEKAKGLVEQATDGIMDLGRLVILAFVAWLAARELLPFIYRRWTKRRREEAEAIEFDRRVKSVVAKSKPPDP